MNLSQEAINCFLSEVCNLGSIASRGRLVPVFLRKPIVTCDFTGVEGSRPPVPPSGSTYVKAEDKFPAGKERVKESSP